MELFIFNDFTQKAGRLNFHAEGEDKTPYIVSIEIEYFEDLLEVEIADGNGYIKDELLDGTDWHEHAQLIYDNYCKGHTTYEIFTKSLAKPNPNTKVISKTYKATLG